MNEIDLEFTVNGEHVAIRAGAGERLLDLLRYRLGLTGTKEGCAEGECGACTVLLDGLPVNSCLVPAWQARGQRVDTVEAIPEGELASMHESGATQCGACTPGVVVTGWWVRRNREVIDSHTLRELMAGNLCRCTGYDGIIEGLEDWISATDTGRTSEANPEQEEAS